MIKSILGTSAIVIMAAWPALAQNVDRTGWPSSFTLGTASQGGTFFVYGSGYGNLIAEELGLRVGIEITGGAMQNMALVHTGEADMGMTTLGPAQASIAGRSPLVPGLEMTNVCAHFPMYETPFHAVALASSGITALSEIPAGARIGFGPAGSTGDTYFPEMITALNIPFEHRNGDWNELGRQLKDGQIDVIGFAAGVPVPQVAELEASTAVNIIEFTAEEQALMTALFPVADYTIPARTYASRSAPARAVSMWNFAIVNCDLPESFVYEATRVVMQGNARMMQINAAAATTVFENWDKNTVIPWHPGAARWFIENGASIPAEMIKS
ncbi:TAXI family TRAP transporter solute-binding subunit [Yoonia vestfoldensis]|uniref:NMT1-like family protein n=1 Tax=Yoonia vestfoldensis TaxID=245188 RepID=A0A1Y0EAS9_9RHOB|nr:TAXI family TRAP transporter solute-binding subunit [Yoonia vestfoldensis]ARU00734.1 NMT1-like family protein [Yoonia vestfoldensis]